MQLLTITGFDQPYRSSSTRVTGFQNMAAILQFHQHSKTERPAFDAGHTATILIYTGVRFERIDFEALRDQARVDMDTPVRVAN